MPWCIFDAVANPAVLAQMPACAALMVRGDLRADPSGTSKEFIWNKDSPGKEYVAVDTANTKLFAGYADGRMQYRRPRVYPWVGKIPWRKEWLPTPVIWPGEFYGLYSPRGHKESDIT